MNRNDIPKFSKEDLERIKEISKNGELKPRIGDLIEKEESKPSAK